MFFTDINDNNIYSNGQNNDDTELFSYDTSNNISDKGQQSFDLNSFSSYSEEVKPSEKGKGKKRTINRKQRVMKVLLTVFLIGMITVSLVVGSFMFYAFTMVDGTMDEDLNNLALNFTTTIYIDDGDGNYSEYKRLHGEFNRIWMDYLNPENVELPEDYEGIPQHLAKAFIAIEDKRFNDHEGVDWKRTMGAFINEFVPIYSSRQGGSTITQQLVKNLTDDRSQKASRKVREIMRARYIESKYSKDTILECYLNTIPMGHGTYGVEVAANYYFNKSVKDLTIAECACLASITKSPTYYAPDDYPEKNKERRELVLDAMYEQKYITKEEYEKALKEELNVVANKAVLNQGNVNSYFVDALITQVSEDLADKYGYDQSHANQLFYNGGYKIYATIDTKMQAAAEEIFLDSKTYAVKSKSGKTMTAGMTVMDYSGHVKAIVGGLGEKTTNRGFNCATDAIRQPGSSIKPLAAYAPAIERDLVHYSTIVNDTKTNYNGWSPKNWYSSYLGNMTVQYALERSVNTIPVYLVNKLTPQVSYDFLTEKLGITTLNKEDINLSPMGMGGTNGGITTLESAAAFAIFGNGGLYYEPTFYTKVTDQEGKIILKQNTKPVVAISEDTATVMNRLLQCVVYGAYGTGTSATSYIKNCSIFAKTGTSNNQKDIWYVGGTPYYIASCWCGFLETENIPSGQGGIAKKLWGNVMGKIHNGLEYKEFEDSSYSVRKYFCRTSGNLATDACPSKAFGWYRKSNIPSYCTAHSGNPLPDPGTVTSSDESATSSNTDSSASSSESSSADENTSSKPDSSSSEETTTSSEE